MRKPGMRTALLAGGIAALAAAGWNVYSRRSIARMPGVEGLDDAELAAGFELVARMPPMQLMRLGVAARATDLQPRGLAVDLGCGPGLLAVQMARLAPALQVVGVDLSEEMLSRGTAHARRAGLSARVSFRPGDVARIPFDDESVDLIVSTLSLHHWGEPVAVLDEMARVLRPGGSFLIFDLRRDLPAPSYALLWFVTHVVVPTALKRASEPLASRDAAYTPAEVAELATRSRLTGWRVTAGPLWVILEGTTPAQ